MRRRAERRTLRGVGEAHPPARARKGQCGHAIANLNLRTSLKYGIRTDTGRGRIPFPARVGGRAAPASLENRQSARLRNNSALTGLKHVAQTTAPPLAVSSAAFTGRKRDTPPAGVGPDALVTIATL